MRKDCIAQLCRDDEEFLDRKQAFPHQIGIPDLHGRAYCIVDFRFSSCR